MKVAVFGPDRRVGVVHENTVVDINAAYAKYLAETTDTARPLVEAAAAVPAQLNAFIEEGARALEGARAALEYLTDQAQDARGVTGEQLRFALDEVKLHAPVEGASRILCALANFADHMQSAAENSQRADTEATLQRLLAGGPKFFIKDHRAVSASGDPLRYPARTERLDYEAEIAVVIGRAGRDIKGDDFASHVWGYTLFNDWSIRDNVAFGPDFAYSKNFDSSATVGPWIVVNEGQDLQDIPVECRVNGELRQSGNTSSMVHAFAALGEHLSRDTTLLPGDLIASGTPKGTAVDSTRQEADGSLPGTLFLKPGDVVEVSSALIGTIRNEVVKPTD
ncbi:fumarylacetoacetate hydrolase family protein [Streptomyces sp. PSKA54]|uniref:Fumarylacetoacetate hydrolase family protein n=1 Tax=Streptomyces himalayensis subsp. aureolus TaxID=2758039 RepID=A0A7W2D5S7_9ACTN|nr:fumarylacetoacetate hydrolase family protein [Streptomyces himalayensis]MBA4865181.1 fumarylacetoacetate hydrolase family protein [Streptomyces himalayensis subsp. aureolus]